jgi:glutamine synthetase
MMKDWLRKHPDVRTIRVAAADLNGQARGKRVPARFADKVVKDGTRFPFSVLNLDIWGEDIDDSPLVFEQGDQDGVLKPTERGFMPMPWLEAPTALLPIWMFRENGQPYEGDPRHALRAVVDRYKARGLTPVCAMELEFFLIDDSGKTMQVPPSPRSGKRRKAAETLSIRALDAFDTFFTDLYDACEAMDIPADTTTSETGLGQFEVNLMHCDDACAPPTMPGCSRCWSRAWRAATALPPASWPSPIRNIPAPACTRISRCSTKRATISLTAAGRRAPRMLRHAVAGCLEAMHDSTLLFAPHFNSYDRLVPDKHAPTAISWGYENRTAAIRIPAGNPAARRIEHRVAGGDVNPYLMLAAILGAALTGLEDGKEPPAADHRQRLCAGPAADSGHLGSRDRRLREQRHPLPLPAQGTDPQPGADQAAGTALHRRTFARGTGRALSRSTV